MATRVVSAPLAQLPNALTIARLAVERLFWRMRNGMSSPSVVITVSPTLGNGGSVATGVVDGAEDATTE